jgi:hypothetical protein
MAATAFKGAIEHQETPADESTFTNYTALSNEGLRLLLRRRMPDMTFLPVTDESRQTIIAMLKITENGE